MYNEAQKRAFIAATYANEAKREEVADSFERFVSYEEAWGGDLVLQPIRQLQPAFDEIVQAVSAAKAKALLPMLKKYRKWYLAQNPNAVCSGVVLLKLNMEDKLRGTMVASPLHLRRVLDEVLEPPEKESLDCVCRVWLWLAFAGVPQNQVTSITVDEVDFYNMQIHHGGRDYEIYREGLTEFHKLCELDYLVYIHRNPDYAQKRPRLAGNQLLRGFGPKSLEIAKISIETSKRFAKTQWSLFFESVQFSGLYYRRFELERIGQKVTFIEDPEERLRESANKNKPATYRNLVNLRHRNNYKQWKALFPVSTDA
jgi:hypothetical protein